MASYEWWGEYMAEPAKLPSKPLVYVGLDEVPILYSNNMVIQLNPPGEFILTFAQISPPMLLGTVEEQREQAERLEAVYARVVARLSMNRFRVEQLIRLLQGHLERLQTLASEPELEGAEDA